MKKLNKLGHPVHKWKSVILDTRYCWQVCIVYCLWRLICCHSLRYCLHCGLKSPYCEVQWKFWLLSLKWMWIICFWRNRLNLMVMACKGPKQFWIFWNCFGRLPFWFFFVIFHLEFFCHIPSSWIVIRLNTEFGCVEAKKKVFLDRPPLKTFLLFNISL